MLDFLMVASKPVKRGVTEIFPKFMLRKSTDLMIRGGDFYAVWMEEKHLWSTDEQDLISLVDQEIDKFVEKKRQESSDELVVKHMWDSGSGAIDAWHKYCQKQCRDSFHMLDEKLIFSNVETKKEDYASKKLNYPLEKGPIPGYDRLMSVLYSPAERMKIEWAIGSIVSGDSVNIQKFLVFYGSAGTGKSTVLGIIQQLFEGYYSVFDAKALGSANNSFALESFKTNPLVAIQHDGDLSRIEDNTRLNSLVSHELMTVNEKFKSAYSNRFKSFLFIGTNKPVKITDSRSGLLRRLIDVSPTGTKIDQEEYQEIMEKIPFELGGIAYHCLQVYMDNPGRYDKYVPLTMLGATNDMYNFIADAYYKFKAADGVSLNAAWALYKEYCEDAKVAYPFSLRVFREELRTYFKDFREKYTPPGSKEEVRNYYLEFDDKKFTQVSEELNARYKPKQIEFDSTESIFDRVCSAYPAQLANDAGTPRRSWDSVSTTLADIDTHELHYVRIPQNHIVIDFDITDDEGRKCFDKNLEAASKWPATYAELSKSGCGIHLHYIYNGDPMKLSRIYAPNIEIKVFSGNSSLRRKLTKCNFVPIATISSGLPIKEDDKVINFDAVKNEKALRTLIKRNLCKEYHPNTKPSIDFINHILEEAYTSGLHYDVTDMRGSVLAFAANSTNNANTCIAMVNNMHFKSDEPSENIVEPEDEPIVFFDVEVFPNLFLINWKFAGEGKPVVRMINPSATDVEAFVRSKTRKIGFNNRRYDNHMIYARMLGYTNEELYNLSQKIINGSQNAFLGEAYNLSYTDIYDFMSSGNKMSLKKWEIKIGIHHQELGLPWDKPVPEDLWIKVAGYCDNDVIATEAVFNHKDVQADWSARQILADLAGMSVNDTTNSLTTKIIFGSEKHPQSAFLWRDLSQPVFALDPEVLEFLKEACPEMMAVRHGEAKSLLPYFPGYKYENGKNIYKGRDVGRGGNVYSEPGMYGDVGLLDISSQHPHSAIAECLFGPKYTRIFRDIVEGRVDIKHEDWEALDTLLDGKLKPYIKRVESGEITSGQLANALKTAINSVYGLTSASFENAFKDPRNINNIVALRGALFMEDLKEEVQKRGFTVAHIKTDSIKIPDATPEIIQFCMEFAKKYGYTFEHEATYDRMCLVNRSVYIAKYKKQEECQQLYGYTPKDNFKHPGEWTATGTQFQIPYVFKTLFSKEPIKFEDMCETKSVTTALYLDMNENLPDVSGLEKERDKRLKKNLPLDDLDERISAGHNYKFVGKVGLFCPIKPGGGGGILTREKDGNYSAATGTIGYRWLEAEQVKILEKYDWIDKRYYDSLVTDAVHDISEYGDFEWFVSDDPYISSSKVSPDFMNIPEDGREEIPFEECCA